MPNPSYPAGYDCLWIASDRSNRVAAFVTAGEGPIPAKILSGVENFLELGGLVDAMPALELERPTNLRTRDFDNLARRGIFAYDWSDVHRMAGFLDGYELISSPTVILKIADLQEDLRQAATIVRFESLEFKDNAVISIDRYFECIRGISR